MNSGSYAGYGNSSATTVKSAVRIGQVITFALVQGVVFFAAIVVFLSWNNGAGPAAPRDGDAAIAPGEVAPPDGPLPLIGAAALVIAAFAGVIAPMVMRSWAIHDFQQTGQQLPMPIDAETPLSHEAGQLVSRLMVSTLISQAIFEAAGFINLVLLMVTGQILLVIAAVIAVFAIAVQCPRTAKILDRLEQLARA